MVSTTEMDDYSGLAARAAAGVDGLRGCLILSRDGLVLGAHPDDDEAIAKPGWLRFATLGDPERSFVEFGDQVWAYVRRGPYAAFAVADAGVRPGLVIDQLEQALLTAEESRTRREGLRAPEGAPATAGPRIPLHPPTPTAPPVRVTTSVVATQAPAPTPIPVAILDPTPTPVPASTPAPVPEMSREPAHGPSPQEEPEPDPVTDPPDLGSEGEEEPEVDRVLLAQEFAGLLQELRASDEVDSLRPTWEGP